VWGTNEDNASAIDPLTIDFFISPCSLDKTIGAKYSLAPGSTIFRWPNSFAQ